MVIEDAAQSFWENIKINIWVHLVMLVVFHFMETKQLLQGRVVLQLVPKANILKNLRCLKIMDV